MSEQSYMWYLGFTSRVDWATSITDPRGQILLSLVLLLPSYKETMHSAFGSLKKSITSGSYGITASERLGHQLEEHVHYSLHLRMTTKFIKKQYQPPLRYLR